MATVTIKATQLEEVKSVGRSRIAIQCDMTEADMREAFGQFLERITEAQLADWMKEFGLENANV